MSSHSLTDKLPTDGRPPNEMTAKPLFAAHRTRHAARHARVLVPRGALLRPHRITAPTGKRQNRAEFGQVK